MKTLTETYKTQDFSIIVKFLGPTNHRGSRVKLTNQRFNKSITLDWDYSKGTYTLDQVGAYLIEKGVNVISFSELKDNYIILVEWDQGKKLFNID